MTKDEIKTEIKRLTAKQRQALSARFGFMAIASLRCREFLGRVDGVEVVFENGVAYDVWIGPRGSLRRVTCLGHQ